MGGLAKVSLTLSVLNLSSFKCGTFKWHTAKTRADRTLHGLFSLLFTIPWLALGNCAHCYAFALLGRSWFLAYCSSSGGAENLSDKRGDRWGDTAGSFIPQHQGTTCPSSPLPALCNRAAACWRSAGGTEPSAPNWRSSGGTNSRDGNQTCCYGNLASFTGEGTTPPLCSSCEASIRNSTVNFHAAQEQEQRRLTGDTSRAKNLTAWLTLWTCSANPLLVSLTSFVQVDTAVRKIPFPPHHHLQESCSKVLVTA